MTNVTHHTAIRVADLERSVRFYEEALGAICLGGPLVRDGEYAEMVVGGPAGTSMRVQAIGFDGGGALELFEFVSPREPTGPRPAWTGTLMHVAVHVTDTDEALARVEAAGGTRMWPEVIARGPLRVIYVHDPDGNVLELIDRDMAETVEAAAHAGDGRRISSTDPVRRDHEEKEQPWDVLKARSRSSPAPRVARAARMQAVWLRRAPASSPWMSADSTTACRSGCRARRTWRRPCAWSRTSISGSSPRRPTSPTSRRSSRSRRRGSPSSARSLFLASDESRYVTGTTQLVDAGCSFPLRIPTQ